MSSTNQPNAKSSAHKVITVVSPTSRGENETQKFEKSKLAEKFTNHKQGVISTIESQTLKPPSNRG